MRDTLLSLLQTLEKKIEALNSERLKDRLSSLKQIEIRVLGQIGLMLNSEASRELQLVQTRDLDAIIKGDWSVRVFLKEELQRASLELDDLSDEIWMPPGTKYWLFYDSSLIKCEVADPIYILTSKAVKAPEKNRQLIEDAIAYYGETLVRLIDKHGGTMTF